ncbi:MAG TPA: zinc-binding dehydrogenase [Anaerolineaceae bacterium]|nr:zinc-binding dehydrogenase [Anaerolineaceae bacterium]
MMKAYRLYGFRDLRISHEPVQVAGSGEKVIHVKAVGICGTDLNWFTDFENIKGQDQPTPLILGHEISGITEDGIRVAVDPSIPCRKCEHCLKGNPNLCENVKFAGYGSIDGGLREKIVWDSECLFPIPDSFSYADAAMLEPLGVALHAVDLAKIKAGMTVGLYGCGPIGLLIIQLVRLAGAGTIIATDKLVHRMDKALALGANQAFLAEEGLEVDKIMAATHQRGVDVAFEVAGEQGAVDTAFQSVVPGGKVLLVGIPADDRTSFQASVARRKGLTIKMVRRMKHTYPRAIELVEKKLVDVRSLVTHRFPLDQVVEAFAVAQRREGIKVIIEP